MRFGPGDSVFGRGGRRFLTVLAGKFLRYVRPKLEKDVADGPHGRGMRPRRHGQSEDTDGAGSKMRPPTYIPERNVKSVPCTAGVHAGCRGVRLGAAIRKCEDVDVLATAGLTPASQKKACRGPRWRPAVQNLASGSKTIFMGFRGPNGPEGHTWVWEDKPTSARQLRNSIPGCRSASMAGNPMSECEHPSQIEYTCLPLNLSLFIDAE